MARPGDVYHCLGAGPGAGVGAAALQGVRRGGAEVPPVRRHGRRHRVSVRPPGGRPGHRYGPTAAAGGRDV